MPKGWELLDINGSLICIGHLAAYQRGDVMLNINIIVLKILNYTIGVSEVWLKFSGFYNFFFLFIVLNSW
jgi:hypothetical protein